MKQEVKSHNVHSSVPSDNLVISNAESPAPDQGITRAAVPVNGIVDKLVKLAIETGCKSHTVSKLVEQLVERCYQNSAHLGIVTVSTVTVMR